MQRMYTAKAKIVGGRDGRAVTSTGYPDLQLKPPASMGGPADQSAVTNPEQLFALGYGACFLSTLQFVAKTRKIRPNDFTVDSTVNLDAAGDGFQLSVRHEFRLPGIDPALAEELVASAHEQCVYSKAVKGNIPVELAVDVSPLVTP
jgi:osmotically inducible protein OsmC